MAKERYLDGGSNIAWTDYTFNPWIGCARVSKGCINCYAEAWARRAGRDVWANSPRRRTSAANWKQPLKWNELARAEGVRRKVFCASLADWLDAAAPAQWRAELLDLIAATPWLHWQLLTKRPEQWAERLIPASELISTAAAWLDGTPPRHVWAMATVEDQDATSRIADLLTIPARVRGLSIEPLLGPLDLFHVRHPRGGTYDALCKKGGISFRDGVGIDWVIVGGESGPHRRPMELAWLLDVVRQCQAAGVAVFVKQDVALRPGQQGRIPDEIWALKQFPKVT